jgi:hypothetical protein
MEKKIAKLRKSNPISFSTYISKWWANAIKRVYNVNNKDTLKLYTYVFPYGTYRVLITNDQKGVTDCDTYVN